MRKPILTITKKDLEINFYNGTGDGGMNRNKNMNCVRMKHAPTNVCVGSQTYKSKQQNLKSAFQKLAKHKDFVNWLKIESARKLGDLDRIEREVNKMMWPENLKVEVYNKSKKRWEIIVE